MNRPILESVAISLLGEDGPNLDRCRVILPNRRSGLFLQQHLVKHAGRTVWMPRMVPLSELIDELSGLTLQDPVETLFDLYDLYKEMTAEAGSLDEFYYWGEMMLGDFDEIDKCLVDAGDLFRNLSELKAVEEPLAGMEEDQLVLIRQFWEGFRDGPSTREKERFLEIWERLPALYRLLKSRLEEKGMGYRGMQYREIAGRIMRREMEPLEEERVLVIGFNALNPAEKKLFGWLRNQGAEFVWDYDPCHVEDGFSEAGRFMRDNLKEYPPDQRTDPSLRDHGEPDIRIFELPSDVLQARMAGQILLETGRERIDSVTDTAVVLCDEELLMPLLLSLPGETGDLNVTMGYPLKNSPVALLTESLIRLQHNSRRDRTGGIRFYHTDVERVLLHPYLEHRVATSRKILAKMTEQNLVTLAPEAFEGELETRIFREVTGAVDMVDYFRGIFEILLRTTGGEDAGHSGDLQREFLLRSLIHLNKLERLLAGRSGLSPEMGLRLMRKSLNSIRVPFEGEPLSGLQVMGILETRMLDFRHVILLSMSEESMPAPGYRNSYIPYSLRLAFGLPDREDMDAIYAYYFYRLLQRAERVDLLYNGRADGIRTGEMSRYLHQVRHQRKVEMIRPLLDVVAAKVPEITLPHSDSLAENLHRYLEGSEEGKFLSPSAINTYITCPLKFYLRYLAGLGEQEEVTEELDAVGIGTVIHETIRTLYEETGEESKGVLDTAGLKALLKGERISRELKIQFRKHHLRGRRRGEPEGRNILIMEVMRRYLRKIVETDLRIAPLHLLAAEKAYTRVLEVVSGGRHLRIRMGGLVDRVDRSGGTVRVIDYKSGNADLRFRDVSSLFDGEAGKRNPAAMQTLLYAWLVGSEHPSEQLTPGLYIMRELYKKEFSPLLIMGTHRDQQPVHSFAGVEEEFLQHLRAVAARIFDPGEPFSQTGNRDHCRHCDFAALCHR